MKYAFPKQASQSAFGGGEDGQKGMSLREYYAGQAMVGVLMREGTYAETHLDLFTKECLMHADALIKALEE